MKALLLDSTMNFICKYHSYSELDKKKLRYGLEGIYLTITKMIILVILSCILGIFEEFICVTLLFNIIRYTGFGFHAEKSYQCLLFSIFNFIVIPYISLHINFSNTVIYGSCGICILHYLLFAPADTKKRPLPNKKKRVIRKIITVMIGIVYTMLIILFNSEYWTDILLSALIIQTIIISPLTYWVFKEPYNNYKMLNTK